MHATRDTLPVINLRGAGGRVMPGVRLLLNAMEITRTDFLDMISKWESEGASLDLVVSDEISNEGKSFGMISVCRVTSISDNRVTFEWAGGSLRIFPFLPEVRFWYDEPPPGAPPDKFGDTVVLQELLLRL